MTMKDGRYTVSSSTAYVQKYFIGIVLFIAALIASIFFVFSFNATKLIREQMISQAKSLFSGVMVTRVWIASHSGVYVPYDPDDPSNVYTEKIPGLNAIIKTEDGKKLVLKTPATSIREISDLANKKGEIRIRITSLSPVNPMNSPDHFETEVLESFENKAEDLYQFSKINDEIYFRYMSPLIVKKKCLKCHEHQGYKEGEVRGALSLAIPAEEVLKKADNHKLYTIISGLILFFLVGLLIHYIFKHFLREISDAQAKLFSAATTDVLTDTYNRRFGMELLDKEISRCVRSDSILSIGIFDLDHFKKINDTYGHLAGDQVLIEFADLLKSLFRDYDIIFRYGGEEFVVVLPNTDEAEAIQIIERIREKIEQTVVRVDQNEIQVTVSVGVTEFQLDESIDMLISRADCILYRAKSTGRNRVMHRGSFGVEPQK